MHGRFITMLHAVTVQVWTASHSCTASIYCRSSEGQWRPCKCDLPVRDAFRIPVFTSYSCLARGLTWWFYPFYPTAVYRTGSVSRRPWNRVRVSPKTKRLEEAKASRHDATPDTRFLRFASSVGTYLAPTGTNVQLGK